MPVPTAITDLSQTAASNSPAGSESPITADDYHRAHAAFIALLRDGKGLSAEADLASGATCDIGAQNTPFVRITGTTTITSFGTNYNGPRFVRFSGALTLTHNATTLVLPGAANITTVAGDSCVVTPISGGWVVSQYQRTGAPGGLYSGAAQATTSGTSIDFTGIPSWVRRITISLAGVSVSGTSEVIFQIGDSGGVETAGYLGAATAGANAAVPSVTAFTTGFAINAQTATNLYHGCVVLTLLDSATNTWAASGNFTVLTGPGYAFMSGSKALSTTLDRVRITTVGGVNTFDAGSANILYE
jgi:hypothetical protein